MREPRRRPRGLTLALLACTVLYGLYPLGEALFYLVLTLRRSTIPTPPRVYLSLALGLGFLLLLIPAWRGRPPQIRLILTGAVVVMLVITLIFAVVDLQTAQQTLDSTAGVAQARGLGELLFYPLMTAYIVFYLNRYPSRAYYRGE